MKIIALFFPAFISITIYCKRQDCEQSFKLNLLIRYAIYTMIISWCDMSLITYIFKIDAAVSDFFESFGFYTKYVFVAIFLAWSIPYIEEIVGKYIHVSFRVEAREKKAIENIQKN